MAPALLPSETEPLSVLLMNTVWADRAGVHDALETGAQLQRWLGAVARRLPDGAQPRRISRADVDAFRRTRSAVRQLAAERTADPRPRAALPASRDALVTAARALNEAAAAAPPTTALDWPGGTRAVVAPPSARPVDAALAAVAADAVDVLSGRDLRACLAPGCVLYFLKDHPRREWCSPACGNRVRAARHYARHRGPSGP